MAKWRAEALKRFPELRETIDASWEVMALWIELEMAFEKAYREPRNNGLIARIYSYADWCNTAERNDDAGRDPPTSVMVAFYEHIPTIPATRDDMPIWFSYEEIAQSKGVFDYIIGPEAFEELLAYMRKHRHRYVPRDRDRQ